jgi:hypothetical protein
MTEQTSPYFSQKPRACPTTKAGINMLLLKLTIRQALIEGLAVSYSDRIFIQAEEEKIQIFRVSEPAIEIKLDSKRTASAVDYFVDQFIYEACANIDQVGFHESDATTPHLMWPWLRQFVTIGSFLSDEPWLMATIKQCIALEACAK